VSDPFPAQGEEEYPYRLLGGTNEVLAVGKQEMDEPQAWDNPFGSFNCGYSMPLNLDF